MAPKAGPLWAKALGINVEERAQVKHQSGKDDLTRGESVFSVSSADAYIEDEPTALEWFQSLLPSGHDLLRYLYNLFPFTHWILRYNMQWLAGDMVAGSLHPDVFVTTVC